MMTRISRLMLGAAVLGLTGLIPAVQGSERDDFAAATATARDGNAAAVPITPGKFQPTWDSLQQYEVPDWFRNAKFGIWAHWGPQCQPEHGDWYAQRMYMPGGGAKIDDDYKYHLTHYGHPSKVGFKDVIELWHAENFDPDKLMALYKRAGAQYFMAMANHHDNFDLWNSKYQPWNSVNVGPHKDLIAGWEKAAHSNGMRFGVSVHAARAWSWYEVSQGADRTGPLKGVPYDGRLTAADGKGQWWDGLDPQDLYAQNHAVGEKPSEAYRIKYFNRVEDLISNYKPDLVYFDDSIVPLNGQPGDYGLKIVADFYNRSMLWHDGKNEAVVNAKQLKGDQRKCLVLDIERGKAEGILPEPWQTDTCIGNWHYDRRIYDQHGYKSSGDVIRMLIDIVSKNGNLMLNIPVRSDGTIDEQEQKVVEEIARWMPVNSESILSTRPWTVYGEGPSTVNAAPKNRFGGIADVTPFTAEDIRYTQSIDGKTLYASVLAWPDSGKVILKSLARGSKLISGEVGPVTMLGSAKPVKTERSDGGLKLAFDSTKPEAALAAACVFKIELR